MQKTKIPFLQIGETTKIERPEKEKELSKLYTYDQLHDKHVKINGYKEELFKRFIDTVYRDYLLMTKNMGIYNSIDSRLYNGGGEKIIECEFLDIIRENAWMAVIIRSYGLFSDSKNDFYTLDNFLTIFESKKLGNIDCLKENLQKIRENESIFGIVKGLRNKIHAHRDANYSISIDRNDVINPLITLAKEIIEKILTITDIKPYKYSKNINLHDYNGNCIWSQIDLKKIHSK